MILFFIYRLFVILLRIFFRLSLSTLLIYLLWLLLFQMNWSKSNICVCLFILIYFRPWHIHDMGAHYDIEEPSDIIADIIKEEVSAIHQYIVWVIGRDVYRCDTLMSRILISYFYHGEDIIELFLKTRPFDIVHQGYTARLVIGFKRKYIKWLLLLWIYMISNT
jgi:hypothetical protein